MFKRSIAVSKDRSVPVYGMGMKRCVQVGGSSRARFHEECCAEEPVINEQASVNGGALNVIKFVPDAVRETRKNIRLKY